MSELETFAIPTRDGVALAAWSAPAVGERKAVLVCGHAMMATSRYLHSGGFAHFLAERGIEVYGFDFRGHGASVPPDPRTDSWTLEHYAFSDLPAVLAAVAQRSQVAEGQLVYLGHSLGGVAALAALSREAISVGRLTLWATSLWMPGPSGSPLRRGLVSVAQLIVGRLGYAPVRRLGLGSADEPRSYVEQLVGWAREGRFRSASGFDYEEGMRAIDVPTWGVVGLGDRLCGPDDAARFLNAIPSATMRQVGRACGDAIDPDHFELFTSSELAPLWEELVSFAAG